MTGCGGAPKRKEIPGTYRYTAGIYGKKNYADGTTFELRGDGTFARHLPGGGVVNGLWNLPHGLSQKLDPAIEFDGGDQFALTHRDRKLCWETREDYDYWCRDPK
jgi:hypothetical protein